MPGDYFSRREVSATIRRGRSRHRRRNISSTRPSQHIQLPRTSTPITSARFIPGKVTGSTSLRNSYNKLHWMLFPSATPKPQVHGAAPVKCVQSGPTNYKRDEHLGNMLRTLLSVILSWSGILTLVGQTATQFLDVLIRILNNL